MTTPCKARRTNCSDHVWEAMRGGPTIGALASRQEGSPVPSLTGGEIVARTLTNYGVEYAAGIPGHVIWVLLDAFLQDEAEVDVLQVFHEQSAVHVADGYYRASGK